MEISIFTDKAKKPNDIELKEALGNTYLLWKAIRDYTFEKYQAAVEEWNFPGKKYGWSFRIKDKKRAIVYLLPRDNFFKVAFVFGQKAVDQVLESNVISTIKDNLKAAKVYAEGRGIRIEIRNNTLLDNIKKLIDIKIAN